MSNPNIPPRPWRVRDRERLQVFDADDYEILSDRVSRADMYHHIVRLVNAEPEIVAALEDAADSLSHVRLLSEGTAQATASKIAIVAEASIALVRVALAKVRSHED